MKLNGKKTYISGALLILAGLIGFFWLLHNKSHSELAFGLSGFMIFNGLGFIGVKHSNNKQSKQIDDFKKEVKDMVSLKNAK